MYHGMAQVRLMDYYMYRRKGGEKEKERERGTSVDHNLLFAWHRLVGKLQEKAYFGNSVLLYTSQSTLAW